MADFQINGTNYKSRKMDAMAQLKVLKRIAPAAVALKPLFGKDLKPNGQTNGQLAEQKELTNLDIIGPIAEAIAILPDDDMDYVIDQCMSLCQRENNHGGWATIW